MTKAFIGDVKKEAKENDFFRKVLFTGAHSQLVLMSLAKEEDIGKEVHKVDQVIYVIDGEGKVALDGAIQKLEKGDAVFVPAGVEHNVINTDHEPMKIFTIYAPPQHADGTIHRTKADAMAAEKEVEAARA
jgi:mannose-6-phosphate isomerase-like protein (cupin superfamily)